MYVKQFNKWTNWTLDKLKIMSPSTKVSVTIWCDTSFFKVSSSSHPHGLQQICQFLLWDVIPLFHQWHLQIVEHVWWGHVVWQYKYKNDQPSCPLLALSKGSYIMNIAVYCSVHICSPHVSCSRSTAGSRRWSGTLWIFLLLFFRVSRKLYLVIGTVALIVCCL